MSDFSITYYFKIFQDIFAMESNKSNSNDLAMLILVVNNFCIKVIELFNINNYKQLLCPVTYSVEDHKSNNREINKINNINNINEIKWTFSDIILELLNRFTSNPKFISQIHQISDILNVFSNFFEYRKVTNIKDKQEANSIEIDIENVDDVVNKYLINSFNSVLAIVDFLFSYNSKKSINTNSTNANNILTFKEIKFDDYPEFILISACKLLNFIFENFDLFLEETLQYDCNTTTLSNKTNIFKKSKLKENVKYIIDLFELYNNLYMFYFSNQYLENNNTNGFIININKINNIYLDEIIDLEVKFNRYLSNFKQAQSLLIKKISNDNNNIDITIEADSINLIQLTNDSFDKIITKTKPLEQIFKFELLLKCYNINKNKDGSIIKLNDMINDIINNEIENKKLIMRIASIIYQSGNKELCLEYLNKVIEMIIKLTNMFNIYTFEEFFMFYVEYITICDDKIKKINYLNDFSKIFIKLFEMIDKNLITEYCEWIFYQLLNYQEHFKM